MQLSIPRDQLLNPTPPRIFLCNTARKVMGQLPATNVNLNAKWRQYSELTFEIQRTYVDLIDGETKVHLLYDKVEAPRNVLVEGYGLFCLQDIDDTSSDNDIKSVSAFSAEYATSNKYLTNFHINTGDVDSVEVLYNEKTFGLDYSADVDSFYKFASGSFDPYENYYKRNYTDSDSYTYEQVQIADANEYNTLLAKSNAQYAQLADRLYMKNFPNVQFYNPNRTGLSLLHLVFENIPEWSIGNVDQSLWRRERKFSEDRISVYDFLNNNVSETFGCTFVWDSLTGLVHCYEEVEDDEIENEASTRWETDVYISKDNLASECKVSYSSDNIKTKLVVTGSDDLDIREVNLGRNEIMDLSFYHTEDWMETDLFEKYDDYIQEVDEAQTGLDAFGNKSEKYPMSYPDAVQGWVAANNRHHELMHAVPSEDNVLLVGDEFKKLFCIYTPIDTAYAKEDILKDITSSTKFIDGPLYYDKQCTVPITNIEDKEIFVVGGYKLKYIEDDLTTELKSEMIKLGNQYNDLVNGNVDYNKRPFVSPETMREVYPEFDGEIATTWDMDVTYGDGRGGVLYTIKFTPILENGTVLNEMSLDQYINDIFIELDNSNADIDQALRYDASHYRILINWQEGEAVYDDNGFSELDKQLGEIKNEHWEIYKIIQEGVKPEKKFQVMENLATTSTNALIKKLNQYHVDEDTKADDNDHILLKLKNSSSDVATIRIYDDHNAIASEYNEYYNYYSKNDKGVFAKIDIKDGNDFNTQKANFGGNLYTNNYQIQSIVVRASHGTPEDADPYTMRAWINGELTAEKMNLSQYDVTYIGTMGAYFVLAKDEVVVTDTGILEVSEDYLKSCGVNLLKEKHKIYTSLFQTQTEAMFSQEKYQCIVQDEQPEGDYKNGTRWLDTNSSNGQLYEFNSTTQKWVPLTGAGATASKDDKYNYENYQRYLDNYNKLRAVQKYLTIKDREAEYCLNGYVVDDTIELSGGQSVTEKMEVAARKHLAELKVINNAKSDYTCTGELIDAPYKLYTFTTSFDPIVYGKNTKPYSAIEQYYTKHDTMAVYTPVSIASQEVFNTYDGTTNAKTLYVVTSGHTFAVYLKGDVPYVAYANSQGVYQMIMEYIRDKTEMSEFFKDGDLWLRLSPFIKEDEYNDSNFLLTGYESEEERISICEELMEAATKELKVLCKPSLEFSMTMANILALPEFEPLVEYFQLGNFIKVEIREGYVKRTRLLEVNLNFDDLSDFNCTFGNLVTTKSETDKSAELFSQAITAGKQVTKSGNSWQKSVDKTNKLESDIANGLQDAALKIRNASGQNIEISENGLIGRKLIEGTTNQYEDEQVALINNKLVFTADNWNTSKSCFGKFEFNGEERWGVLSDAVVSGFISGSVIEGGSLKIGGQEGDKGTFIVNNDGSVQILGPEGTEMYAGKALENTYRFQTRLTYDGLTVFTDIEDKCTVTCHVYDTSKPIVNGIEDQEITTDVISIGGTFTWNRAFSGSDDTWEPTFVNNQPNVILIQQKDVERNAQFDCVVEFEESKFNTEGGTSE
ncbi:MAG: hypothetical protein UH850_11305 [Paludibacteraceae bacterium]|nr:hypothetical protein [Paludibacteraceae bacterium]